MYTMSQCLFVSLKTRTLVFEYSKYTALIFNYNILHVRCIFVSSVCTRTYVLNIKKFFYVMKCRNTPHPLSETRITCRYNMA